MAMLASKSSFPAPHSGSQQPSSQYSGIANYRIHDTGNKSNGFFASPTESEFSESHRLDGGQDSIRRWDEDKVADWIRAIDGCAQYVELFKRNNINGENLMEMDATHLKEIGVKKMGHRLRISTEVKLLRNKQYKKATLQQTNRNSLAVLDGLTFTPPSSASPRPMPQTARSGASDRSNKRMSRQVTGADLSYASTLTHLPAKTSSRPTSPFIDDGRSRSQHAQPSPKHMGPPGSASTSGRQPMTPAETPQTARFVHHVRQSSQETMTNSMVLPSDKPLIRVIFPDGRTTVISMEGCKTAEDAIRRTLRKGNLNEAQVKNHCFYVLDGVDPNPVYCRRLGDQELVRIINNRQGLERGRLIFRKIHAGEPDEEQLRQAANIANQQQMQQTEQVYVPISNRSQLKIEKLTGESLAAVSYPLSPASVRERERHINMAEQNLERADSSRTTASQRIRRIKELHGGRPPSELIASDLSTYFPDFEKEEIDRTVRMSIRRSKRLSRAASRLSTVSNLSMSSLKDAPPLPSISDAYLNQGGQARPLRPLSVVRLGASSSQSYRDSVASSSLEPLDEESPLEPSRKSYMSLSESDAIAITNPERTNPERTSSLQTYYDDGSATAVDSSLGSSSTIGESGSDSLNKRLSQVLQEDGEEEDPDLNNYLEQDSWENVQYMKGALIGQGSFGSVYLALHSVTGELMAVKQVEMPSSSGTQLDAKKNNMVEALKHEIGLLRDLKHPNIVQYLGSNSDDTHLNIFLEYVPGGSVATMLVNYGPLNEGLISNFVRQILTGLAYLHSRDIIHRDIKGANILVDNKGSVKISDFGISKRVEASTLLAVPTAAGRKAAGPRVSLQGSVFWMAPEVVKQTAYTRKADIWSLGCLIVEMFTGHHPHPNCTQLQAIFKIGGSGDASPTIPENASEEVKEFLKRTFEIDHESRPTAEELLGMPLCAAKV